MKDSQYVHVSKTEMIIGTINVETLLNLGYTHESINEVGIHLGKELQRVFESTCSSTFTEVQLSVPINIPPLKKGQE